MDWPILQFPVANDKIYILTLFVDRFILEDDSVKFQVKLALSESITWVANDFNQLKGFGFTQHGKHHSFEAATEQLNAFFHHLRLKVMFTPLKTFYSPVRLLDEGTTSKVFLVKSNLNGDKYACKSIPKKCVTHLDSLLTEIQTLRMLRHPNILEIYEVYEGEHSYNLILEYLQGGSLRNYRNLKPQSVRDIMKNLLQTVDYIHSMNVMHRDLKPHNIFLKHNNNFTAIKLVDFGLATQTDVDKYIYPKCGTPGYLAPEVANLTNLDHKYSKICDIFSLGAIFYRLLTDEDLFQGANAKEIYKNNQKCHFALHMDSTTEDLLQKMLQKDPNKRITAHNALKHKYFQEIRKVSFQKVKYETANFKQEEECNLDMEEGLGLCVPVIEDIHLKEELVTKESMREKRVIRKLRSGELDIQI